MPEATIEALYLTVPLSDGVVIGGPWPYTIITWPNGNSRGATKPEYDLFQALEKAHTELEDLRSEASELRRELRETR